MIDREELKKKLCDWCKEPLSGFIHGNENDGFYHVMCKTAKLHPNKTDEELWRQINPPDDPFQFPKRPWPAPRKKVEN